VINIDQSSSIFRLLIESFIASILWRIHLFLSTLLSNTVLHYHILLLLCHLKTGARKSGLDKGRLNRSFAGYSLCNAIWCLRWWICPCVYWKIAIEHVLRSVLIKSRHIGDSWLYCIGRELRDQFCLRLIKCILSCILTQHDLNCCRINQLFGVHLAQL
jgi:hypothetical protein